jgi:serine/threonine protein kinase
MSPPTTTRRYEPLLKIASGGTASVYVGSAAGALGFRQLVAIKRPHAHLADDPAFCAALVEEARIASRLHHANIVDVRDVEVDESGIQLVMDYVEGASLSELIRSWAKEPPARGEAVALRIVLDACEGLRALHELTGDDDAPLGLVHRDVSPANILVGLDGVARIADFGLAKPLLAVERTTSEGALRGKLGYMAPEYIRGKAIDRRIDVFAMGIVLWEVLSRKRLFRGENDGDTLDRVQTLTPPLLAELLPSLGAAGAALDHVVARALAKDPEERLPTIAALSAELEKVVRAHDLGATHADVREAFAPSLRASLDDRRRRVQSATSQPPGAPIPSLSQAPPEGRGFPGALVAIAALAGVSALVAAAVISTGTKDTAAWSASAGPRTVATEARPLASEGHARATASAPSALAEDDDSTSTAALPRGARPLARPRPHPKATSDEPGNKPPRPNPYASSSPR